MKTYQIDEYLVREIIDVLERRRDELACTTFHTNYIADQQWKSKELSRKLKNLKRVKFLNFSNN